MHLFDSTTLITYAFAAIVLVLTPGPGQASVMAYTINGGRKHGLLAALGLEVGTLTHTLAAGLGLSAILATSAIAFTTVKFIGALYLLFLGIRLLLSKKTDGQVAGTKRTSDWRVFAQAIATGVLNPKVALFFLAFLPQFVRPERGAVMFQFLFFGCVLACFGFIGDSFVALLTVYFGGRLNRNPGFQQWRQRVTGMLFIGIGARLAFTHRN